MHRMVTQKRRVVYLSDEAWEAAKTQAKPYKLTASAYIQSLIIGGRITPAALEDLLPTLRRDLRMDRSPQAQRDAILRKINRGG